MSIIAIEIVPLMMTLVGGEKKKMKNEETEKQFEQSVSTVLRDFPAVVSHFSLHFEHQKTFFIFLLIGFFHLETGSRNFSSYSLLERDR